MTAKWVSRWDWFPLPWVLCIPCMWIVHVLLQFPTRFRLQNKGVLFVWIVASVLPFAILLPRWANFSSRAPSCLIFCTSSLSSRMDGWMMNWCRDGGRDWCSKHKKLKDRKHIRIQLHINVDIFPPSNPWEICQLSTAPKSQKITSTWWTELQRFFSCQI